MKYKKWDVELEFGRYSYFNNISITLLNLHPTIEDGETIAVATVNIEPLEENEVSIKDYSENEGMLQWLIDNGIIEEPHRYIQSGWVRVPICKLKEGVVNEYHI